MIARWLLLIVLACSCGQQTKRKVASENNAVVTDVDIFKSKYGGFGYDIRVNGKLAIHQPNIPALSGNRGFATEESARKVARLVVGKIESNQMPPTLTQAEVNTAMRE